MDGYSNRIISISSNKSRNEIKLTKQKNLEKNQKLKRMKQTGYRKQGRTKKNQLEIDIFNKE